jgi:RsmE family RNA methyltransferase
MPSGSTIRRFAPASTRPAIIAIGPEGGWVEFELALMRAAGFTAVSLGPRALRVEAAVVAALARLG